MSRREKGFIALLFLLMAAVLFPEAGRRWIDHDENVYVTSAVLALKGVLPIFDYPYIHQPAFSFVYALLFTNGGPYLLLARMVSALSMLATVFAVWYIIRFHFSWANRGKTYTATAALVFAVMFYIHSHFTYGVLVWNHALPTLLLVLSLLFQIKFFERQQIKDIFFSGLLFALAVSFRASLAPLVLPLFASTLWLAHRAKHIFKFSLTFVSACFLGSAVSLYYLVSDPYAYLFDLVTFHSQVDTQYLEDVGRSRSLGQRLSFLNTKYSTDSALIFTLLFVLSAIFFLLKRTAKSSKEKFILAVAASIWLFAVLVSVMKNIILPQYVYVLLPFFTVVSAGLFSMVNIRYKRATLGASFIALSIMLFFEGSSLKNINSVNHPERWFSYRAHFLEGKFIKAHTQEGKVLTLSPLFAVEANRRPYLAFVNGPFSYRTAAWVNDSDKMERKIIGMGDLRHYTKNDLPVGIYLGWEPEYLESEFVALARELNYKKLETPLGKTLYVPEE